jgi:glucose/arabinose dehydrogenase
VEQFATGARFAPGMAFDSEGNLFFSDNEGGGNPTEELNLATRGRFYGHSPPSISVAARLWAFFTTCAE